MKSIGEVPYSSGDNGNIRPSLDLKVGDWVTIRPAHEILATLDQNACLEQLPFMPQMIKYCGESFRVRSRAHKMCDTVFATGGRHMTNAVFLDGIHCDGGAFGGCEMACSIVWKEAWLTRAGEKQAHSTTERPGTVETLETLARNSTQRVAHEDPKGNSIYICQATKLPEATQLLPWWNAGQYVEDYRSGNARLSTTLARLLFKVYTTVVSSGIGLGAASRGLYNAVQWARGGVPFPVHAGRIPAGAATPKADLGLRVGDLVRVKNVEKIMETVDTALSNRGMSFSSEMVPYCGKIFRVKQRMHKIINEKTGRLITLKNSCLVLDGADCHGRFSDPINCPRGLPPYWREIWLERVETGQTANATSKAANGAAVD